MEVKTSRKALNRFSTLVSSACPSGCWRSFSSLSHKAWLRCQLAARGAYLMLPSTTIKLTISKSNRKPNFKVLSCKFFELEELPSMMPLTSLEELWADGCVKLKSILGLDHATKLRMLIVKSLSDLEELPSMETLTSLEDLRAEGCVKLKSIRGLEHATKLRILNVTGLSELEELPSMETLTSLEQLGTEHCVKLKSIWGLEHATQLRILDVHGLSELEELPSMKSYC